MNLAQSVVICLYEIGRQYGQHTGKGQGGKRLASNEQLEVMFDHMRKTLLEISYLNPQNPEHIMRSYRQMLGRASLDERDVRILRGLLSEIDRVEAERRILAGENDGGD